MIILKRLGISTVFSFIQARQFQSVLFREIFPRFLLDRLLRSCYNISGSIAVKRRFGRKLRGSFFHVQHLTIATFFMYALVIQILLFALSGTHSDT